MRRHHWFEFEDQPWLPASMRSLVTDLLGYQAQTWRIYEPIVPLLRRALRFSGQETIVDLGSGSGGPLPQLIDALAEDGHPIRAVLTDKYPNARVLDAVTGHERLTARLEPVNATDVPAELGGLRTLFACFHHFKPNDAQRVLDDAVSKRAAIGIFEFTERRPATIAGLALFGPLVVWLHTPGIQPRRMARWLWTYLIPVAPLLYTWDAVVSHLRTYTVEELHQMTAPYGNAGYVWEAGQVVHDKQPVRITYLLGWPQR